MTKFIAQSSAAFRTKDANAGRVVRAAPFVVIAEADDGSWCELDADDLAHGERLAVNWVNKLGGRGACVWAFNYRTGRLLQNPEFRWMADVGGWNDDTLGGGEEFGYVQPMQRFR